MAHLRDITYQCNSSLCSKQATQQVYSSRNEPFGRYCRKHANVALKLRQHQEDEWAREHQGARL